MDEIFTKRGMRIGLLFGGIVVLVNVVVAVINTLVPFLVIFTWVLSLLGVLALVAGGYANGYVEGFSRENLSNLIKKSIGPGLWAALLMGVIGGLVAVFLLLIPKTVTTFGFSYTYSDFGIVSAIVNFLGQLLVSTINGVFWFVVGGFVFLYLPKSSLPEQVSTLLERVKAFAVNKK